MKVIESVPILFGEPYIERQSNKLIVHADIIASSYFVLTRYEEMVREGVRDEHRRFPGKESLLYKAGFIERPIVDEYGLLLRKWLRNIGLEVTEPQRQFSILLTHDVDCLKRYSRRFQPFRTIASSLLGKRPLKDAVESTLVSLKFKKDPYDTFDQLIEIDRKGGAKSIYYFIAGSESKFDYQNYICSKKARQIIKKVKEAGAEIGVHLSYNASIKPELIAKEKELLESVAEKEIHHCRFHFLRWMDFEVGYFLAKTGLYIDSSLGYADIGGFRLGVCHPIQLFDPEKFQLVGVEEHPLILTDTTLFDNKYIGLSKIDSINYTKKLLHQIKKHNGELVILWHNTFFCFKSKKECIDIYSEIVELL